MDVPQTPNEQPEISKGAAEVVQNFQTDIQQGFNQTDLAQVFGGQDTSRSTDLPEVSFGEVNQPSDEIAQMSPEQLSEAITAQESYVAGLQSQIERVTAAAEAAEKLKYAELSAQANAMKV